METHQFPLETTVMETQSRLNLQCRWATAKAGKLDLLLYPGFHSNASFQLSGTYLYDIPSDEYSRMVSCSGGESSRFHLLYFGSVPFIFLIQNRMPKFGQKKDKRQCDRSNYRPYRMCNPDSKDLIGWSPSIERESFV